MFSLHEIWHRCFFGWFPMGYLLTFLNYSSPISLIYRILTDCGKKFVFMLVGTLLWKLFCVFSEIQIWKKNSLKYEEKLTFEISIWVEGKIICFKLYARAWGDKFFFFRGAIKSYSKESYLNRSKSEMKRKSLIYDKKW